MEFPFKKNIKVVVDFEIGETIIIRGYGPKLDGKHIIEDIVPNFGRSQSGVMAKLKGHDSLLDIGWLDKIENKVKNP